ncbi:hypothetical protein ATO50_00535 [Aeromonas hydrophila]|nr:hypothetical protein ATO50_00535 [Aeromonas hydrophila]
MARYLLPDPAGRVGCPFCCEGQRLRRHAGGSSMLHHLGRSLQLMQGGRQFHLQHGGIAHNHPVAIHDVVQGPGEWPAVGPK